MHPFQFQRPKDLATALNGDAAKGKFLAGGTTLIDLMKLEVERPAVLLDINQLPFKAIEEKSDGFRVGSLVTNSELAHHAGIKKHYLALSEAILAGASVQLRNKATTGGNILQRTRCVYFRDPGKACNKREPGSGCSAIEGHNRNLAILGTSEHCIATNPSDMNVALAALEAEVLVAGKGHERSIKFADFHLLPGKTPHLETSLAAGEFITGISLPKLPPDTRSSYVKLRDRASYEFALASIAVVATMAEGRFARIRIAMGGLGTKPWRVPAAEKMLEGQALDENLIRAAGEEVLSGAKTFSENKFKLELARRCFLSGVTLAKGRGAV